MNDTTGPPGLPGFAVTGTDSPPICTTGPHCRGKSEPRAVTGASTLPSRGSSTTVGTGVGNTSNGPSANASPHVKRTVTAPSFGSFGTVNDTTGPPGLLPGCTVTGTDCPAICTAGAHCGGKSDPRAVTVAPTRPVLGSIVMVGIGGGSTWNGASANASPHVKLSLAPCAGHVT